MRRKVRKDTIISCENRLEVGVKQVRFIVVRDKQVASWICEGRNATGVTQLSVNKLVKGAKVICVQEFRFSVDVIIGDGLILCSQRRPGRIWI